MDQTRLLHGVYVKHSGRDLKFTMYQHYALEHFIHEGFTADDMELVCKFLNNELKGPNRMRLTLACLKFANLVENIPAFQDHLALAKAVERVRKPDTGREAVLKATGRKSELEGKERSAAEVLAGMEALRKFKEATKDL